jgi:hypothetical protein
MVKPVAFMGSSLPNANLIGDSEYYEATEIQEKELPSCLECCIAAKKATRKEQKKKKKKKKEPERLPRFIMIIHCMRVGAGIQSPRNTRE